MVSRLPNPEFELLSPQTTKSEGQEQFMRCHLVPDTAIVLPVAQLVEALTIPMGQIVPIPHMPAWVMGVYNWRGEILWMVDLGHLVGLTPWHRQMHTASTFKALVLRGDTTKAAARERGRTKAIALVVNRVEDIEWCSPNNIYSPPASAVTPELVSFLRGYWVKPDGEILVVLDGEAILAAMPAPEIAD